MTWQQKTSRPTHGINGIPRDELSPEDQQFADVFNAQPAMQELSTCLKVTDAAYLLYCSLTRIDDVTGLVIYQRQEGLMDALQAEGVTKPAAYAAVDQFATRARQSQIGI